MGYKVPRELLKSAVVLSLLGLASAAIAQEHTFKWSHHEPLDSILDVTTKAIIQEIEEKSNGRIKIELFPASQLGDWTEVYDQVTRGVVDFATQPVSTSYDQRLLVRGLPYSVMNYEEAEAAYFSDDPYLFNMMSEMMAESGVTALAVVAQGFGGGGFRECPEGDLFDVNAESGLKMRFPPGNQAWEKMVGTLGYSPTPVPWGELYLALQTGLVDAQVGGQPYSTWSNFRDVTDCWVQYNTHFQNAFIFGNRATWESLSDEDRKIIQDASYAHAMGSLELARAEDQKYLDEMAAAGIEVIIPNEAQLATLATTVRQQVWPLMDEVIGKDIMDVMRQKSGI